MRTAAVVLLLSASCAPVPENHAAGRATTLVLTGVNVVDVIQGRVLPSQSVIISDGRIRSVQSEETRGIPAGAVVIDGRGKYLIPGLWDMHTHVETAGPSVLPLFVAYGVTGVRDMGADSLTRLLRWRSDVEAGTRIGPRLKVSGPILDNPPPEPLGTMRLRVRIPDAARAHQVVDSLSIAGVDHIKVYRSLSREAYFAVAEQARARGLRFTGHLPTVISLNEAAAAGQWTIEHVMEIPFPRDSAGRTSAFAALRAQGTWITPNLVAAESLTRLDESAWLTDPRSRYVSEELRAFWEFFRGGIPKGLDPAIFRQAYQSALHSVDALHQSGVPLLVGTDLGFLHVFPGSSVHDEMELLVRAGLTPLEALRAATLNPARALGMSDSLGAVKPGYSADLVLLDADPLTDIRNTQKIHAVVLKGRYLDRAKLDSLLVDVELRSGAARQ